MVVDPMETLRSLMLEKIQYVYINGPVHHSDLSGFGFLTWSMCQGSSPLHVPHVGRAQGWEHRGLQGDACLSKGATTSGEHSLLS